MLAVKMNVEVTKYILRMMMMMMMMMMIMT